MRLVLLTGPARKEVAKVIEDTGVVFSVAGSGREMALKATGAMKRWAAQAPECPVVALEQDDDRLSEVYQEWSAEEWVCRTSLDGPCCVAVCLNGQVDSMWHAPTWSEAVRAGLESQESTGG